MKTRIIEILDISKDSAFFDQREYLIGTIFYTDKRAEEFALEDGFVTIEGIHTCNEDIVSPIIRCIFGVKYKILFGVRN